MGGSRRTDGGKDGWVEFPPGGLDDLAAMARGLDGAAAPSSSRPIATIAGPPRGQVVRPPVVRIQAPTLPRRARARPS